MAVTPGRNWRSAEQSHDRTEGFFAVLARSRCRRRARSACSNADKFIETLTAGLRAPSETASSTVRAILSSARLLIIGAI